MNERKLAQELTKAGITYVAAEGRLTVLGGDPAVAQAVLDAHDPAPTRAERLSEAGLDEADVAFRLVQTLGGRAPAWAQQVVAAYLQRVNEALSS